VIDSSQIQNLMQIILHKNATLVAVSKTKSIDEIRMVYDCGQKIFGENKVQEIILKQKELPQDIKWHMIGHLQTNKVKLIAPFISLIESVDSEKLLAEISKEAQKNNRTIDCLLEIKIAKEETKYGLILSEAKKIIEKYRNNLFPGIRICGLMGIATDTDDRETTRAEFNGLFELYKEFKKLKFEGFDILSMGMSGDYELAIEEGSNMVRIGSAIFGKR